jgi:hypothetical protein
MKKIFLLGFAIAALASCNPKATEVVEKVESATFPSSEIAEGSQIHMDYCGKCHKHKTVTDYTQDQWKKIIPNMAAKAKLDGTQESKVLQYVLWQTEQ